MFAVYILCSIIAILNLIDGYQTTKYIGKPVKLKNGKTVTPFDLNPFVNRLIKTSKKSFWVLKIVASILTLTLPLLLPNHVITLLPPLLFVTLILLVAVTSAFIHTRNIEKTQSPHNNEDCNHTSSLEHLEGTQ